MKHLQDLEAAEVSLVPKGANKRKFLIFKSKEVMNTHKELLEKIKNTDPKILAKVEAVMKEHMEKGLAEDAGSQRTLSERAQAALKAVARILAPFKDELGGDILNKVMEATGMEMGQMSGEEKNDADAKEREQNSLTKEQESMSPEPVKEEHQVAAMKAAKAAYKAELAKLGYQKYPEEKLRMKSGDDMDAETEEEDTVSKQSVTKADGSLDLTAVPESVRPAVEAIYKSQQELVKKNEALEAKIASDAAALRKREIVAKAETFTHVGLPKEEVIASLTDADKIGTEAYVRICKQFEAINEQIKKSSLFGEIGSNLSNPGRTTWAMIEQAAEGYVAKSGEKVSPEQAVAKFLDTAEGKRLYNDYQAEKRGK